MPKRLSKKKEHDFAVNAFRVVQEATAEPEAPPAPSGPSPEERHEAAVTLGRLGGKKSALARAKKLTPEQRREIARKAAATRWQAR